MGQKYSIWKILFYLFAFIGIVGIIFVTTISFFFYRTRVVHTTKEREITLDVLSNTIAGPSWTVATEWLWYPGTIENIINSAKKTPGVRFIRIIDEKNQTILKSTIEDEVGKKISNLPKFDRQISIRDGQFNGELIKDSSIRAKDGSNLWVGFSLAETKKETLYSTIIIVLTTILLFLITVISVYMLVKRIIIRPLYDLISAFNQLKNKNYNVVLKPVEVEEIDQMFQSFNYMSKELGRFHNELEDAKKFLEVQVQKRTKELNDLTTHQKQIIENKTKELRERMVDLERFEKFATGRELKMIELKEEIIKLKNK